MSLEEEVTELLRGPVQRFGSAYAANPRGWFAALTPEEQGELILGSFNGIFDAMVRIAREIDSQH